MFVPIVSLQLIWLIGLTSEEQLNSFINLEVYVPIQYILGLEYNTIKNLGGEPTMIDNCHKWFYRVWVKYHQGYQEYWGFNEGRPWGGKKGSDLIYGHNNIL